MSSRRFRLTALAIALVVVAVVGAALALNGRTATNADATLRLTPAHPYTPKATGGARDDYHCFLLEPKLSSDRYVTGTTVVPGRPANVHHVILYEVLPQDAAAARAEDAKSGGRGWTCFGGPGVGVTAGQRAPGESRLDGVRRNLNNARWLGAWVPGKQNANFRAGTGMLLPKQSLIVMQVHYNLQRLALPDRTRVILTTASTQKPLVPLASMLLPAPVELPCADGSTASGCQRATTLAAARRAYGPRSARTPDGLLALCDQSLAQHQRPVGDASRITARCDSTIGGPTTIYGVAGHMHLRGKDIAIVLNPGTARAKVLLHIPRWDFAWQDFYLLQQPIVAKPNDVIRVTCRFDNSAAGQPKTTTRASPSTPRYVLWGEGTADEMCLGILQVAYGKTR